MNYRTVAIHSTRAVYAISWYNIAPGLLFIESDLSLTSVQIGLLVTSFYIGVGIFQIPAGYLATKFGNRNIASLGILILGISGIFSFLSPNYEFLLASRALGGVASAMFFSPAMGTLRSVTDDKTYGFHVNVFNGAFEGGAAAGIVGWGVLDVYAGWRLGFFIAGLITIAFSLIYFYALRRVKEERSVKSAFSVMKSVILNKKVWLLGFAGTAAVTAENVAAVFIVYYLEKAFGIGSSLASLSGTLFMVFGFFGGIVGGFAIGRSIGVKKLFYFTVLIASLSMSVIAFIQNIVLIYVLICLLGAMTAPVFSAMYVLITKSLSEKAETTASMSVVNGIQEIPGSIWPYAFTFVYAAYSFAAAWIFIGAISLGFLALMFLPSIRKLS